MCGTAAAASSRSTVMRTISEPARASAATCRAVSSTSAVSVLVIDCTTMGAPPPTVHAADIDGHRPASLLRPGFGHVGSPLAAGKCQTAPPPSTRPVTRSEGSVRVIRLIRASLRLQCVQMPLISITGDFGVKPAARGRRCQRRGDLDEDASPTAPQRSQIRNTTRSPAA